MMAYKTEPVRAGNIKSEDIVIALMGPTGSGKSQIIDSLTGQTLRAGTTSSLKSVTNEVSAHRVLGHEKYGNKLVLVDTPAFDNTNKTDKQVLEMISKWMMNTYERQVTLTGILHTHRITDTSMDGTPHRNLLLFGELCGQKTAGNVVLLTTMWDKVRNREEAEKREASLKERYWNVMIDHGATVDRFYLNDSKSPWTILDNVIERKQQHGQALLLQEEMVDVGKRLNETRAWKALSRRPDGLLNSRIKSEEQVEGGRTDAEEAALRAKIRNILNESEKMSLARKILLYLKVHGKKGQTPSMAVATPPAGNPAPTASR